MPLHKNKVIISSIVYFASLLVIAAIFGMWHNSQLKNGTHNYMYFTILVIIALMLLSLLYFSIFKIYRKEINLNKPMLSALKIENKTEETAKPEEKATEVFNKDAFISDILPETKKDIRQYCETALKNIADKLNIVQGIFYIKYKNEETFEFAALYAYYSDKTPPAFKIGENIPGQTIKDRRVVVIPNIPENYIPVVSGLGSSKPKNLLMVPVFADAEPVGLIEVALFTTVEPALEPALKELGEILGKNIIKLMK